MAGVLKILCADDDRAVGELVRLTLAHAGHEVSWVPDGLRAWEVLAPDLNAYDIVISDQRMPNLSGPELIGRLRAAGYRGRIIVFSGIVSDAGEKALRALGADLIIRKPAPAAALVDAVARLANRAD
jgi:DNA-binding response OmpR family regulator